MEHLSAKLVVMEEGTRTERQKDFSASCVKWQVPTVRALVWSCCSRKMGAEMSRPVKYRA